MILTGKLKNWEKKFMQRCWQMIKYVSVFDDSDKEKPEVLADKPLSTTNHAWIRIQSNIFIRGYTPATKWWRGLYELFNISKLKITNMGKEENPRLLPALVRVSCQFCVVSNFNVCYKNQSVNAVQGNNRSVF